MGKNEIIDLDNLLRYVLSEDAMESHASDLKASTNEKATNTNKKINIWFDRVLLNMYKFKNAQLDPLQNSDLIHVLRLSQPSTELNFKLFPKYYAFLRLKKNNGNSKIDGKPFGLRSGVDITGRMTTLNREITKSISDLKSSLKSAQNSVEYKRIIKNDYENTQLQNIPLGGIVADMKATKSSAAKFQNELNNFNQKIQHLEHIDETTERMCVFLNLVTHYYKFRISLLTVYLQRAKSSLKGTLRNIVDSKESQYATKRDTSLSKAKWSSKEFKPNEVEHLREVYQNALKASTYKEYKPYYDELTNALGIHGRIVRKIKFDVSSGKVKVYHVETNKEKINTGDRQLYHGVPAGVHVLKELIPAYCGKDGYLFPEPRIYFHLGVPLNRCSNKPDKDAGERSYSPRERITTVWKDNELGGTAVYIHRETPLPVKMIQLGRRDTMLDRDIKLRFNEIKK